MGNISYTSRLWRMMSGDESTGHSRLWRRRRSAMEEKMVGYGGETIGYGEEERGKTGKRAERGREQVWLRPKKLERCLRQQGITGNSYRLLHGDVREMLRMISEANSRPSAYPMRSYSEFSPSIIIPSRNMFVPTNTNKRMRQISNEVNALLKGIIERREKEVGETSTANDDLLGLLMESNYKEMQEHDERKNVGMSNKDVIEECKLFTSLAKRLPRFTSVDNGSIKQAFNLASSCKRRGFTSFGNKKPDGDV
ncbi:Cytochrome P450 CYP72A219 [Vitis vinifera]|uniref:Cytochrome P450 CYP72A219 n=1 Tax=Vitis vinifera TaxID=29760 RepID=A0A438CAK2_VITVI|nr:Cytochrome P450 CYP72A219 [Vitis vinifera]